MPEQTKQGQDRNQHREFRRVTANVVAELRSRYVRDSYAALSLPEILDQHLLYLVGDGKRLGRKQKLKKVRDEFLANLDAMKATPPSAFREPDPANDVNTPP
jgi:hypothetical protein